MTIWLQMQQMMGASDKFVGLYQHGIAPLMMMMIMMMIIMMMMMMRVSDKYAGIFQHTIAQHYLNLSYIKLEEQASVELDQAQLSSNWD